jgi:hypothetical protein
MANSNPARIRLLIHHPTPAGWPLAVIGGHPALGDWRAPQRMTLGPARPLPQGGQGRYWEYAFAVSHTLLPLEYRYVMLDDATETAVWEREPNRCLAPADLDRVVAGVVEIIDANFVAGMECDAVPPALFLGPYPQSLDDVNCLRARGVSAVLNVQTDADMRLRHIPWDRYVNYYRQAGIECYRLPITDFDEEDLVARLPAAVQLLKRLVDAGNQVYVHCTAGMGRSPAVVIAYLCRYHGKELLEALNYVKRHRPVICPNVQAIHRALFLESID